MAKTAQDIQTDLARNAPNIFPNTMVIFDAGLWRVKTPCDSIRVIYQRMEVLGYRVEFVDSEDANGYRHVYFKETIL